MISFFFLLFWGVQWSDLVFIWELLMFFQNACLAPIGYVYISHFCLFYIFHDQGKVFIFSGFFWAIASPYTFERIVFFSKPFRGDLPSCVLIREQNRQGHMSMREARNRIQYHDGPPGRG